MPTDPTVFLGWSYEYADRFTIDNISMITTNAEFTYTFQGNNDPTEIIIYGYFIDDGPMSLDFCFTPVEMPSTITYDDKLFACNCTVNGGATVTVYFDKELYLTLGIEGVIWYSDVELTTPVANGYYIDGSQAFSTIYGVTTGVPINHGICGGTEELCVI
jgi:hypothetical protein